ncbi:MAG: hypothetical protein RID15_00355 [Marinovum algicola]|uniref:Chemotaxis protein MotC n=1 Tax=Marinovum algicola TaxID=42444 RepID=A0A975W9L5_9RHOB|nr:hypothetical protein [Marinovum algicola]SEJ38531.1 hypothetical protein SAMN04487940_105180 [Marinovum algicola]SLN40133.1 hypothetical protein MAA5396_01927 [Marinovum algicola]
MAMRRTIVLATVLAGTLASAGLAQPLTLPAAPESRRIAVVVDRGITHTRQLPTAELRRLRKAMVGNRPLRDADLRRLAEAGDGLAALRMVKRLRPRGPAEHASDIAYYASIASGAGRQGLFDDFVAALYLLDPAREPKHRVSQFIRVLYPHAWAGNSLAQDALIALNGPGKLFGPMSEATRARIRQEGGARMVLALAMKDLSRDDLDAAALTRVIGYLELAERTGDLPVRTMAQSLRRSAEARQRHREAT